MPNGPPHALYRSLLLALLCVLPCRAEAQQPPAARWENISEAFFTGLGVPKTVDQPGKRSSRVTNGLAVDPATGQLFLNYSTWTPPVMPTGLYTSRDRGASWAAIPNCRITGRGECGFSFNFVYPYTGRFAFFTIDGTGGLTADSGVTWSILGKHKRGFDFGDVDWSSPQPKTMFALEHEPWFKCLSTDGGQTWQRLDEAADAANKPDRNPRLGVVNATTLLLGDSRNDGISLSTDLGKTWMQVASFRPLGHHPVHYGQRLYWTTSAGVITSDNGKDWSLLHTGLPNATWGPYFGKTEADMMVVSDKGIFITHDAAQTWSHIAAFPKAPSLPAYDRNTTCLFFAWDFQQNIIYAERSDGACYRMTIAP